MWLYWELRLSGGVGGVCIFKKKTYYLATIQLVSNQIVQYCPKQIQANATQNICKSLLKTTNRIKHLRSLCSLFSNERVNWKWSAQRWYALFLTFHTQKMCQYSSKPMLSVVTTRIFISMDYSRKFNRKIDAPAIVDSSLQRSEPKNKR